MEFIKKDKKFIIVSFFAGLVISLIVGIAFSKAYADKVQQTLSDNVIRFHVIANSDSENDQELKLKVRDEVIKFLEEKLDGCRTKEESRRIIEANIEGIELLAEKTATSYGFPYEVKAEVCNDVFPLRQYGDVRMPAGDYDTLKISIGKAQGHNWWCVVYPPLCFVDIAKGEITDESENVLLEGADSEVLLASGDVVPEIKFKIVELWQEWEHKGDEFAVKP